MKIKKLLIYLILLFALIMPAGAAMTLGVGDVERPTAYWWGGLRPYAIGDQGLGWMKEVETQIEAWTLDGGTTLTFPTNAGTFDNATNHAFTWTERSETITWTFGTSNDIVASSSSGVILFDYGAIVPAANQFLFNPVSVVVGSVTGTMYYDSDTNKFFGRNNSGLVEFGASAGTPAGSDTYLQYNNSSSFGGIATVIWDGGTFVFTDDQATAWGTSKDWLLNFDDSAQDQLLLMTDNDGAVATTDPMFQILVDADTASGTNLTSDQDVFGIAKGSQASNVDLFVVDAEGDTTIAGDLSVGGNLTVTGTFYQAAIASAAAGDVALNIDAAGSGQIILGATSTGKITTDNLFEMLGNVDIGDTLASDTLSILAKIDTDVYLDDDSTDSPALIFRDDGEDKWTFKKVDTATGNLTVTSNVGTSDFQIVTGNLKVGGGSESNTLDGQDAYITGTFEVDGASDFLGAMALGTTLTVTGTATFNGDVAINDQIAVALNADDEEILVTGTATNVTADNLVEFVMAAQDTDTYILALTQTPNADGNNDYLICADNTGSDAKFTVKDGGETAWTLDAAVDVTITAAAHTSATGALDIDFDGNTDGSEAVNIKATVNTGGGGAETMSALMIDLDDDADAASVLYGIRIIPTDVDGSATVIGIDLGVTLDVGLNAEVGAGLQAMTIDAATVDHTGTDGVIDIEFDSKTDGAEAVNIKATYLTGSGGSNKSIAGMEIELVNNGNDSSDILYGLIVNVSGSSGTGKEKGIYIKGTGIDAAFQADFGYIRVGTGGTPTVTPGDDDIYAEGTVEADGGFNTGTSTLKVATVDLTAQEIRALVGTPIELVAAPSAGEILEFISALLILDQDGDVFTEAGADDNLAIEYDGGSGAAVSETIEMTGFITAAVDQVTRAIPVKDPIGTAASQVEKNLALVGLDDEIGGNVGNEAALRVIITYRVVTALGL